MSKKLTPSDIVILVSGAVLLIVSFLPWIDADTPIGSFTENAWEHFPGWVYPAIAGTLAALHIVLTKITNTSMPGTVFGLNWTQIHWILAVFAGLTVVALLFEEGFTDNAGVGFWLSLVATAGLIVGAAIRSREPAENATETPATG